MQEPDFWLLLSYRVTDVLKASRDDRIRFLWVNGFDTGSSNVSVDLGHRIVTARAWVYGGKITNYLATLYLSLSGPRIGATVVGPACCLRRMRSIGCRSARATGEWRFAWAGRNVAIASGFL